MSARRNPLAPAAFPVPAAVAAMAGRRPLRDQLGEGLRRQRHGLMRPLWADLDDKRRERWRKAADACIAAVRIVNLALVGVEGGLILNSARREAERRISRDQ
jgi:hypothetical protein